MLNSPPKHPACAPAPAPVPLQLVKPPLKPLVVCGPFGTGKRMLLQRLLDEFLPKFEIPKSATTRVVDEEQEATFFQMPNEALQGQVCTALGGSNEHFLFLSVSLSISVYICLSLSLSLPLCLSVCLSLSLTHTHTHSHTHTHTPGGGDWTLRHPFASSCYS